MFFPVTRPNGALAPVQMNKSNKKLMYMTFVTLNVCLNVNFDKYTLSDSFTCINLNLNTKHSENILHSIPLTHRFSLFISIFRSGKLQIQRQRQVINVNSFKKFCECVSHLRSCLCHYVSNIEIYYYHVAAANKNGRRFEF